MQILDILAEYFKNLGYSVKNYYIVLEIRLPPNEEAEVPQIEHVNITTAGNDVLAWLVNMHNDFPNPITSNTPSSDQASFELTCPNLFDDIRAFVYKCLVLG